MILKLEDHMPHRAPMILLNKILAVNERSSTCEVTITERSMFYENNQVPGWVGIEYMAQTISVYGGFLARKISEPPGIGFLLGARKYISHQAGFKSGQKLVVRAEPVFVDGEMGCFKATIQCENTEVAEAVILTYKASEAILTKMVPQK